jgi:uncharacterized coiled-coil protein SlyX
MTTALVKLFPAGKTDRHDYKFDALDFDAKPLAGTNQPVADARYYVDNDDDAPKEAVDRMFVPQTLNRWPLLFTFIRERQIPTIVFPRKTWSTSHILRHAMSPWDESPKPCVKFYEDHRGMQSTYFSEKPRVGDTSYGFVGAPHTGKTWTVKLLSVVHKRPILDMRRLTEYAINSLHVADIVDYVMATPSDTLIIFDVAGAGNKLIALLNLLQSTRQTQQRTVVYYAEDISELPGKIPRNHILSFPGDADDVFNVFLWQMPVRFSLSDSSEKSYTTEQREERDKFKVALKELLKPIRDFTWLRRLQHCQYFERSRWFTKNNMEKKFVTWQDFLCMFALGLADCATLSGSDNMAIGKEFTVSEQKWRKTFATDMQREIGRRFACYPAGFATNIHRALPIGFKPSLATSSVIDTIRNNQDIVNDFDHEELSLFLGEEARDGKMGTMMIMVHKDPFPTINVLQIVVKSDNFLDCKGVRDDLHQLSTTVSEQQKLLTQQAEERQKQNDIITAQQANLSAQQARIDELTNKLLETNTTTIAGVTASDGSDGEDDEGDSDASEQNTRTRKRKRGFQTPNLRLLAQNPICNNGRCTNKVLDKIKSTGAYKKQCSICLANTRASKRRQKSAKH